MPKLPYARSFQDLIVYQRARELQRRVFEVSKGFPAEERYSLTDQIRRASRSVGAQIAEAWAKREYAKHFVSKLTDADGEQSETQHWIITAVDAGYLQRDDARPLYLLALEVGRMLGSMKDRPDEFCQTSATAVVREDSAEFFSQSQEPLHADY